MKLTKYIFLVLIILSSYLVVSARQVNSKEFQVPEQAVGFYSKGTLLNATHLPFYNEGYVKLFQNSMRPFGSREYGTYEMIKMLRALGDVFYFNYESEDKIMIGDISGEVGGEISQHASHQIGLDVDIALIRKNQTMQDVNDGSGNYAESFVIENKVSENFDFERNWFLVKQVVGSASVNRIFTDGVIKKALCEYVKSIGEYDQHIETLRKLRHWEDHQDHFHVRLNCPETSPKCIKQDPPPEGSGCETAFAVKADELGD